MPQKVFQHNVCIASATVDQHLFPDSFSRTSIQALLVKELVPNGIGKDLRIEIPIVSGTVGHQMPDVCKPVRVLGKGNTALLVHCRPNVSGGHSMPWPENHLVKFGQDNLVLHLYKPKLVSALGQVCGHGIWEGLPVWLTSQQRQKVLAPRVVFHPVGGRLDKIHRGTGSRHVLKVGSAQQRVQGMPKLVQKGFDLLVGGKAGLSRVHVAHQCDNGLLVVGIRAIFQTATSYREMGGVRVFSRAWMQIQIHCS